jgi:hypothetical protein
MNMPERCPCCSQPLRVTGLTCPECATKIEGTFDPCPVCSLRTEDRALLLLFLQARGNARRTGRGLGVSYPTARARLDRLWSRLGGPDAAGPGASGTARETQSPAMEVLAQLGQGGLGVEDAVLLLRNRRRPSDVD